jgi:hypothetical protein
LRVGRGRTKKQGPRTAAPASGLAAVATARSSKLNCRRWSVKIAARGCITPAKRLSWVFRIFNAGSRPSRYVRRSGPPPTEHASWQGRHGASRN